MQGAKEQDSYLGKCGNDSYPGTEGFDIQAGENAKVYKCINLFELKKRTSKIRKMFLLP